MPTASLKRIPIRRRLSGCLERALIARCRAVGLLQLLKENDELRHLARSVMNEAVDLRAGISTAKSVNKQLHHENQVLQHTCGITVLILLPGADYSGSIAAARWGGIAALVRSDNGLWQRTDYQAL